MNYFLEQNNAITTMYGSILIRNDYQNLNTMSRRYFRVDHITGSFKEKDFNPQHLGTCDQQDQFFPGLN